MIGKPVPGRKEAKHSMKKIIKGLLIFILGGVLLVSGTIFIGHKLIFPDKVALMPTVAPLENEEYRLGVQFQKQAETLDEYVHVLAEQVRIYNEDAYKYWPGNGVTDQYILAESIEKGNFWLISPQGEVSALTRKEAQEKYTFARQPYRIGFGPLEGSGIRGMYAALSEEDLVNYLMFEKYPYLGTYDVFITYSHELFHMLEQPKWAQEGRVQNASRSERREDVEARAKRYLLKNQLLAAVAGNNEEFIKDAAATWLDYKKTFPEDYNSGVYFDRIEGTAHYFEIKTCLFAAYPDQIKTQEDFQKAMALYASRPEFEKGVGTVAEGYSIGALSCVLLDRLGVGNWPEELMNEGDLTPLDILAGLYADLPAPGEITADDINEVTAQIDEFNKDNPRRAAERIFTMLYQLLF
jgi:hypothetical protein